MSPSVVTIISAVVSMLTAFGVSGLLVAFFQRRFEHTKQVRGLEHDLKEKRYKAINILMLTLLDPAGSVHIREHRPDLRNRDDVVKELRTEMLNSFLFASDDVIRSLTEFIAQPAHNRYIKAAVSMRKDLWGSSTSIGDEVLQYFGE
ncbi:MAG: hypothetical protein WAM78_19950 [Candidatus Sulfotelmatobacter sp.]